jgi:hypothetical protein
MPNNERNKPESYIQRFDKQKRLIKITDQSKTRFSLDPRFAEGYDLIFPPTEVIDSKIDDETVNTLKMIVQIENQLYELAQKRGVSIVYALDFEGVNTAEILPPHGRLRQYSYQFTRQMKRLMDKWAEEAPEHYFGDVF